MKRPWREHGLEQRTRHVCREFLGWWEMSLARAGSHPRARRETEARLCRALNAWPRMLVQPDGYMVTVLCRIFPTFLKIILSKKNRGVKHQQAYIFSKTRRWEISQTSYGVRCRSRPQQTWETITGGSAGAPGKGRSGPSVLQGQVPAMPSKTSAQERARPGGGGDSWVSGTEEEEGRDAGEEEINLWVTGAATVAAQESEESRRAGRGRMPGNQWLGEDPGAPQTNDRSSAGPGYSLKLRGRPDTRRRHKVRYTLHDRGRKPWAEKCGKLPHSRQGILSLTVILENSDSFQNDKKLEANIQSKALPGTHLYKGIVTRKIWRGATKLLWRLRKLNRKMWPQSRSKFYPNIPRWIFRNVTRQQQLSRELTKQKWLKEGMVRSRTGTGTESGQV